MSAAGQRERASERAKKKEKAAGCVSYPPGTYLADRLVFCEPVTVQYLRNTMRALCELAIASMLTAFT